MVVSPLPSQTMQHSLCETSRRLQMRGKSARTARDCSPYRGFWCRPTSSTAAAVPAASGCA